MLDAKKQLLFDRQAEVVKAVAHPLRIAIVNYLRDGEQCVCDIAEYVDSERSNVSRHLSVMVAAGILESRKEGLKVIYTLKTPCILKFFECITEVLRQQIEDSEELLKAM
ncbi:MAG: transcriptional regulator [Planctomycetota bacterium]|nr:MAG: transcriptional regulator [Planctomycetota bacterium]